MTNLELERRLRGWSQTQMAAKVGVQQGDISLMEHGRYIPTAKVLARIARKLGLTSETVLAEAPSEAVA